MRFKLLITKQLALRKTVKKLGNFYNFQLATDN